MIQTKKQFNVITSNDMPSAQFGIDEADRAQVFGILRDNLYSNKILAVVREYSTNAYDANVENGKGHVPIKITLPNMVSPTFKIRDYGTGLTEEEIFTVYNRYGKSTKRETNLQVGTLGMGSKSGFAYANSFTITSWNGGTKKVYEAFIDETSIGTISKVLEVESSDPTGIEITISINQEDFDKFIKTTTSFFMWFSPLPEFHGYDVAQKIEEKKATFENELETNDFTLYKYSGYDRNNSDVLPFLSVKMGNIIYPIDNKYLTELDASRLSNTWRLMIKANIGEFSFTTSRESLEMTNDTIAKLKAYIDKFKVALQNSKQAEIDAQPSQFESICYFHRIENFYRGFIQSSFNWRGIPLNPEYPSNFEYTQYDVWSKRWCAYSSAHIESGTVIIINDGGFPAYQLRARLNAIYSRYTGQKTKVMYLKGTVTDSLALKNKQEFIGATIIGLSSVSALDIKKNVKAVFKSNQKVFKWNGHVSFPYSGCWEHIDTSSVDDIPEKIYIAISKYVPVDMKIDRIPDVVMRLKKIGYTGEIYGLKKESKGLDDSWISLEDYIGKLENDLSNDAEFTNTYISHFISTHKDYSYDLYGRIVDGKFKGYADKILCPILKELSEINSYTRNDDLFNARDWLLQMFRSELITKLDKKAISYKQSVVEKCHKVTTQYPLIGRIDSSYSRAYPVTDLIDYVNMMYKGFYQNPNKQ